MRGIHNSFSILVYWTYTSARPLFSRNMLCTAGAQPAYTRSSIAHCKGFPFGGGFPRYFCRRSFFPCLLLSLWSLFFCIVYTVVFYSTVTTEPIALRASACVPACLPYLLRPPRCSMPRRTRMSLTRRWRARPSSAHFRGTTRWDG